MVTIDLRGTKRIQCVRCQIPTEASIQQLIFGPRCQSLVIVDGKLVVCNGHFEDLVRQ